MKLSAKQVDVSIPHSLYSPDLSPSVFHLFGPLKFTLRESCRRTTTSWNTTGVKSGDASAERFTRSAHSTLRKGGRSVLIIKKNMWKSNLNCVKNVPMEYVNVIRVVIIVSEKKKDSLLTC